MRKTFFLILMLIATMASFTLSSCSDDNDEPNTPTKQISTYAISSDLGVDAMASDYGATPALTIVCLEYNDQNELVNTQTWPKVKDGDYKQFTANERCVKVVIRIELKATANGQTSSLNRYVATVNYLTINDNINIILDGNTRMSSFNPI